MPPACVHRVLPYMPVESHLLCLLVTIEPHLLRLPLFVEYSRLPRPIVAIESRLFRPLSLAMSVESARLFNRISPALPPEYVILVYHACRACSASVNPPSSRLRCLLSMSFLSHLLSQCICRVSLALPACAF